MEENFPAISIIVPVYNGEAYLNGLFECLINQTFRNFEVLCLNDYSTDDSEKIIKEYANRDSRIRYIQAPYKFGLASKGIEFALRLCRGKYFFYMSQDDLIDENLFDLLVKRAKETKADIVLPNMIWYYEGKENKDGIFPPNYNYEQILEPREAFLLSLDWSVHGFALKSISLMRKIDFSGKYYTSDEYYSRKAFLFANKIAFCDTNFYYRQDNANALTKTRHYYDVDMILIYNWLTRLTMEAKAEWPVLRERIKVCFKMTFGWHPEFKTLCQNKSERMYVKKIRHQSKIYFIATVVKICTKWRNCC